MRLLSATVRNYRIHREAVIPFDPSRTLIGGPNEAGKSTLIEAIHRALFMKAKGSAEPIQAMKSTRHLGDPEVELNFEAGGRTYHLVKRFSGRGQGTRLTQEGGQTLQGEEAEAALASVLGVEAAGGKGAAGSLAEKWAHLWVWQGTSGGDPARHVTAQQDELLQRLQEMGGAIALQSDLDGRVAKAFKVAADQLYTGERTRPRAGSELERASRKKTDAEGALADARATVGRLQQSIEQFVDAEATLKRTASELEALRGQQREVEEKLGEAERLERAIIDQGREFNTAKEALERLANGDREIAELRGKIDGLNRDIEPKQREIVRIGNQVAALRLRTEEAESALNAAQDETRQARARKDLASAHVTAIEKRQRQNEKKVQAGRVVQMREEMAALRRELSALPSIDRKKLVALIQKETRLARARASLEAMATGVEVVASDREIRIDGEIVPVGESRTLNTFGEVQVGDGVRLRVIPGGGESLAEVRNQVRNLEQELQRELDALSLPSVQEASGVVASREELQSKIKATEKSLEALDADAIDASLAQAEDELAAAEADVARRKTASPELEPPECLDAAKILKTRLDDLLSRAEAAEKGLNVEMRALRKEIADGDGDLLNRREKIDKDHKATAGHAAQLQMRLRDLGEDDDRRRAIADARSRWTFAKGALETTSQSLAECQPEELARDRERLQRATEAIEKGRGVAQERRTQSETLLRSDGDDDPRAALAQAEANAAAAAEHFGAVERKSKAIYRLHELFLKQQQDLADQFSQPLAEKITGYLKRIFGRDAIAQIVFENNVFKGCRLVRGPQAEATGFDALSGGAQEQVAAAVRLAIAELLAAGHGGTLPVVFDDAFAYSDPARVQKLQSMLDFGASQGLQIIVLTCNPSDYAGLGAQHVQLSAPPASSAPAPASSESPAAETATP